MPLNLSLPRLKKVNFSTPSGDNPLAALFFLLVGVMLLAVQDTLIKFISDFSSFWQIQVLRSFGNMVLIILLSLIGGGIASVFPKRQVAVIARSLFMVVCMFCFFSGAPFLSIAQMAAGLYTYPLFVSILAIPVLGEKIGKWRLCALVVGAVGALLMLNPLADNFSLVQLLPIAAGFFYACNIMILRRYCRDESTLALTFYNAIAFFLSGLLGVGVLAVLPFSPETQLALPFVAVGWPAVTLFVIVFAALCSFLNLFGNLGLTRAYQTAESSWLAPVDFSYLIFVALCGKVIFGSWPTTHAWIGMALIAAAGVITVLREHSRISK